MKPQDWLTLSVAVLSAILLPAIGALINMRRQIDSLTSRVGVLEHAEDRQDGEIREIKDLLLSTRELMIDRFAGMKAQLEHLSK